MGPQHEPTTGFLIWRTSLKLRTAVDRVLKPLGLTHAQYSVLGPISALSQDGRGPSQRELADFTGLEPIYVSKLARALEKAGLVVRPDDPDDPRAVRLSLTDQGGQVFRAARDLVHQMHAELTAPIGGPAGDRDRDLRQTLLLLLGDAPFSARTNHRTEGESTMSTPTNAPVQAGPVGGREINIAAAAARSVRDALFAKIDMTFDQSVVLRALTGRDGPADRHEVVRGVIGPDPLPGLPTEAELDQAVDELIAGGRLLTDATDPNLVTPTVACRELYAEVTAATLRAGAELYAGIPQADLLAARRVLDVVVERAAAVRAEL
ncbi:MAG TPA: MarR family transcriptional regulator [Pseudonocardiaceae bacterium]|nr:MarR family transcriptional regulator [Pseudonocardiaceae bacterium]